MRHYAFGLFFLTLLNSSPLHAMPNGFTTEEPTLFAIPRIATNEYREEGIYRGGTEESSGIRSLKRESTPSQGGERWTLEFSSPNKKKAAPFFQVKLIKAESFQRSDGTVVITEPPKIVLLLRGITGGGLPQRDITRALKKSRFVKAIIPYPPIEDGDTAIELVLSRETLISPHHPRFAENQLVLELK